MWWAPVTVLSIDLWGGVSTKITRLVDRQGRVTLPEAGPLLVSGRSLGEVQSAVQRAIGSQYRDTSADVSVSRLRTIRIYVVGEVEEPGAYDISSLIDGAERACRSRRSHSPRILTFPQAHAGEAGDSSEIDAYDLLLARGFTGQKNASKMAIPCWCPRSDPQVTVTGMVRRPAIYELNGEQTVDDALELAGGDPARRRLCNTSKCSGSDAHEKRTMLSLDLSPDSSADSKTGLLQGAGWR